MTESLEATQCLDKKQAKTAAIQKRLSLFLEEVEESYKRDSLDTIEALDAIQVGTLQMQATLQRISSMSRLCEIGWISPDDRNPTKQPELPAEEVKEEKTTTARRRSKSTGSGSREHSELGGRRRQSRSTRRRRDASVSPATTERRKEGAFANLPKVSSTPEIMKQAKLPKSRMFKRSVTGPARTTSGDADAVFPIREEQDNQQKAPQNERGRSPSGAADQRARLRKQRQSLLDITGKPPSSRSLNATAHSSSSRKSRTSSSRTPPRRGSKHRSVPPAEGAREPTRRRNPSSLSPDAAGKHFRSRRRQMREDANEFLRKQLSTSLIRSSEDKSDLDVTNGVAPAQSQTSSIVAGNNSSAGHLAGKLNYSDPAKRDINTFSTPAPGRAKGKSNRSLDLAIVVPCVESISKDILKDRDSFYEMPFNNAFADLNDEKASLWHQREEEARAA